MSFDEGKILREKLNKHSKETIIDAIFKKFNYMTISDICHKCFLVESQKKAEQEEKRETENLKRFKSAVAEYNGLCKELKEKGVEGITLEKLERMQELLKIIKKG